MTLARDAPHRSNRWFSSPICKPTRLAKSTNRSSNESGGGGGIRTHESLRSAGFQDRSHQPLDHPSNGDRVTRRVDFATFAIIGKLANTLLERGFGARSTSGYVHVNLYHGEKGEIGQGPKVQPSH